jgi:hypothetical protein
VTAAKHTEALIAHAQKLHADLGDTITALAAQLTAAQTQRDDALRDLVELRNRLEDHP